MAMNVTGLVNVTGFPDVGKSSFALECGCAPERMMYVDSDIKTRNVVRQLQADGVKFGKYVPWIEETKGKKELEMFAFGMKLAEDIKVGQYDAVIYDTISELESCFKPAVTSNPKKYRDYFSPQGTIKGAEEWQASFDLEAEYIDTLLSKVPLVIFIAHLKSYNIGGKRIEGKFVPAVKQPVVTKSSLRLWLMRNPSGSPVPIGLVLKRLDRKILVDGKLRTINILPLKLIPGPEDESLWDTISRFYEHPYGKQQATGDEQLTEWELSAIENTLTEDQRMYMRMALLEAESEASVNQMILTGNTPKRPDEEIIADIKAAIESGKTDNDEIKNEVLDATLPLIIRARKS